MDPSNSVIKWFWCNVILQIIKAEQKVNKSLELTEEGKEVADRGSHEALVYHAIPADGISQAEIMVSICGYLFKMILKKNFNDSDTDVLFTGDDSK